MYGVNCTVYKSLPPSSALFTITTRVLSPLTHPKQAWEVKSKPKMAIQINNYPLFYLSGLIIDSVSAWPIEIDTTE